MIERNEHEHVPLVGTEYTHRWFNMHKVSQCELAMHENVEDAVAGRLENYTARAIDRA
jgi:hypothetical protein